MSLERAWYRPKAGWTLLLSPLEWLFRLLATINMQRQLKRQWRAPCPVVIVGNISVGGTGKSPLTISLIEQLQSLGFKVGVVSRGYGGKRADFPYQIHVDDSASESPDEPLMIVRRTGVALVVDPNRAQACQYLLAQHACDVIISDDGLQHYALGRDIEISVIDGARGLGNRHCLPVGPLREDAQRLQSVDFVVVNGECQDSYPHQTSMQLIAAGWYRVSDDAPLSLDEFSQLTKGQAVHAIAGIGNPSRFYKTLSALGMTVFEHSFKDHHQYSAADFSFLAGSTDAIVCMTQKDAVKCKNIAPQSSYYLKIAANLERAFIDELVVRIRQASQRLQEHR